MFVSMNWLKDFVYIKNYNKVDFTDDMTMSGTKVEAIESLGEGISKVVVGKILSIEKHPNADKLVVTKVDVGEEILQIVTGADNINEGDYIPVALVGARLGDLKIKKSKLRGVESHGMLCSAEELGMNTSLLSKDKVDGIYILDKEYPLGSDIKPILGLDDDIVEFELTANRPDCLSILGIAREVAATYDIPLVEPIIEVNETEDDINNYLKISVEDENLCPRYVGRMVKVNEIKPSPMWMQRRLLNSGIRPINNIVDVTNYVMLELGQPLHAFDYDKLETKEILVRRAKAGEKITTLDDIDRTLDEDMIVITNGKIPVGIAGVMGGANSDIDENTKTVVLEAANFNKTLTRHTGKKLSLRSEAQTRFEKGVDVNLAAIACDRAAQLLEEIGAGKIYKGKIDVYPNPKPAKLIEVDSNWVNTFVGIDLTKEEMVDYLERLFLNVELDGDILKVEVPSYRQDLEIKEDIVEEIARIHGYNKIPNTIMKGITTAGRRNKIQNLERKVKNALSARGLYETLTTSFTGMSKLKGLNIDDIEAYYPLVNIINPLGEENSIMRPTLLPGMLQVIHHNYNRNVSDAMFYEIAATYENTGEIDIKLAKEEKKLIIGMYGDKDFFTLKGYVNLIIELMAIKQKIEYTRTQHPSFHPGRGAELIIDGKSLGVFGELHPHVVEAYDLPRRTYVAELNFEQLSLLSDDTIQFEELPKYPGVTRDIALLVEEKVTAKEIEDIIVENGGNILEEVKLFDVYTGSQIPDNHKSMAYALVFRSKEKTLTDEEINEIFEKIVGELREKLGAELRA